MFLNLNVQRNNKRLSSDYQTNNQKSYLNQLNKYKGKSYSTTSLKQQFQQYRNKSLNNSRFNGQSYCRQHTPNNRNKLSSPLNYGEKYKLQTSNQRPQRNLKINDFKKSYLNLDTKLNKCTLNKDYFKPSFQQPTRNNNNQKYDSVQNRNRYNNIHLQSKKQQITQPINDHYFQDQIFLQLANLREQNMILKVQNEELRKQRNIDLQLIARQNQVMKSQQDLLLVSQRKIRNVMNKNTYEDISAYTFNHNENNQQNFKMEKNHHLQCKDCNKRNNIQQVQQNFIEIKLQKMQEEKKLMRKQIHDLVYQSQKLKQQLKKADEKYHREIEHNEKLIKILHKQDKSIQENKNTQIKYQPKIVAKPYLNLNQNTNNIQPISIKRQVQKYFKKHMQPSKFQSSLKLNNYKSASTLLRFNNNDSQIQQKQSKNSQISSPQNLDWCQSQGIKKYLHQINKQKNKQMDQIQNLLKYT